MNSPGKTFGTTSEPLGEAETAEDPSLQHWQAVIACLPSEAKRVAAWSFYSRRLANGGSSADLLCGFVLLLEAHSLFLEQLPKRCHTHFVLPFEAQQSALHATIDAFQTRQSHALAALEIVSERNIRASTRALVSIGIVRKRLHEAATSVDTQAMVEGVKQQLEEKALTPLADALAVLGKKMGTVEQTATAAQIVMERWRRIHLGGIVGSICATALVITGALALWTWHLQGQYFSRRVAHTLSQIEHNQGTLARLASFDADLNIILLPKGENGRTADRYVVSIEDAIEAGTDEHEGRKRGYIIGNVDAPQWRPEQSKIQLNERAK